MADTIRCTRRKQANPRRKKDLRCQSTGDIDDDLASSCSPDELSDNTDSPSPISHSNYHGNSDGIESDLGDQSFSEDDQDITERVERRSPLGKIGKDPESRVNLEEYLNRSDTAVIYPEPVEDIDNDSTAGNDCEDGKPVDCPYCDRSYKRITSLKEHIKYRHEKTISNFSCPECNYCFAYKSQLERHMATHMPGRNQVCDICNKAFVNIYRLQRHMLTHSSGNRKFKCSECGKAFKYKHHLKEHLRIHSGEKPYECPICRKRFSHSGSYSSHISSKKCSPMKENPVLVSRIPAPVKVMNGSLSPVIQHPVSLQNTTVEEDAKSILPESKMPSYMTQLHIKIPGSDNMKESEKKEDSSSEPLTTPPNEAVKKVLQIVDATVSKLKMQGQNTDISKLTKVSKSAAVPTQAPLSAPLPAPAAPLVTPTAPLPSPPPPPSPSAGNESPKLLSPTPSTTSSLASLASPSSPEKVVLPEISKERLSSTQNVIFPVNGAKPNKIYSIVDYTLRKVHEAQAIAKCLESQRGYGCMPCLDNKGTGCKYCGRDFESPIELHQHERYLCELNEDVQKVKGYNSNLTKYYEYQREVLANMDQARERTPSTDSEMNDTLSNNMSETESLASPLTSVHSSKECNGNLPSKENDNSTISEINKNDLDVISEAQEHALRAFYAMHARPSEDGLEKISLALNLQATLVDLWFKRTRKLEEEGCDPSLKSLGLMKKNCINNNLLRSQSPVKQIHVNSNTDVFETVSNASRSRVTSPEQLYSPRASSSPRSTGTIEAYANDKLEQLELSRRQNGLMNLSLRDQEEHSNSNSPVVESSKPSPRQISVNDAPLDLSMPKHRNLPLSSMSPKLVYGYNYPPLYTTAGSYIFQSYNPDGSRANLCLENTLKAHSHCPNGNLVLKRPFVEPYFAYVPMPNGYPPKRMKYPEGMEFVNRASYPTSPLTEAYASAMMKGAGFPPITPLQVETPQTPTYRHHLMNNNGIHSNGISDLAMAVEDSLGELSPNRDRRRRDRPLRTSAGLYSCTQCPKTFQKHSSLLRHVYEHSGEPKSKRPHECKECGKAFKHKHHLMEHARLHSGEKPYQCDKCLKKFSHSGSYSQHMNHRYSYCRKEDNLNRGMSKGGMDEDEEMMEDGELERCKQSGIGYKDGLISASPLA
ncbi:zinc finger E-box-binding homeobox 2-like isoform X1 [Asterias amurensis]|uniref:zinc finger E-box-binding homeobox 2-like isoform X1 n=1 Tax=Asterias amurensis TaxID=7602 RepID=UPI003AB72E8A